MKVALRGLLITGCLLLCLGVAACQGGVTDEPTETPTVEETEPENDEPTEQTEPTEEPEPTPTPEPTPNPTPATVAREITIPDDAFRENNEFPARTDEPTAILFLRDRSQSVKEVCGDRFNVAMRRVPGLIYTLLAEGPWETEANVAIGLGMFPAGPDINGPAVNMLQPIRPLAQLDGDAGEGDLAGAIDAAWDADDVNGASTWAAIQEGIAALAATDEAGRKMLVIFGDSFLDYPTGREWAVLKADDDGNGQTALEEALQAADVELHYIFYDCLPHEPTEQERKERSPVVGYWDAYWHSLAQWSIDLTTKDTTEPLERGDYIRVYGATTFNASNAKWLNMQINGELPPRWQLPAILDGIIGDYLPSVYGASDLWQQQIAYITPPLPPQTTSDGSPPEEVALTEIRLPLPGYARDVTVHTVGLDEGWCVVMGDRINSKECDRTTTPGGGEVVQHLSVRLSPPNDNCNGVELILSTTNPDSLRNLEYPVLVWWTITPLELPPITFELDNVIADDARWRILSSNKLTGRFSWSSSDESNADPDKAAFLNACYRANFATKETLPRHTFDLGQNPCDSGLVTPGWPIAFCQPFDPGQMVQPTFSVTPALNLERIVRVPGLEDPPNEPARFNATHRPYLPSVAFEYQPTLALAADTSAADCDADQEECRYTIPTQYAVKEYYPSGQSAPRIEYYLLAPNDKISAPAPNASCNTLGNHHGEHPFNEPNWLAINLSDDPAKNLLLVDGVQGGRKDPTLDSPFIKIALKQKLALDCNYTYLLIHWPDYQSAAITCELANGRRCTQGTGRPAALGPAFVAGRN